MINGKTKLNSIKVVISKVLVDSSVTHDEFVLGNSVLEIWWYERRNNSRSICQNELDKACFQHDMAYGDFKDLLRRTPSDKELYC